MAAEMARDRVSGTGLHGSVPFFCHAVPTGTPEYTLYPSVPKGNEYSIWVQLNGEAELMKSLENKELTHSTPVSNGL